MGISHWGVSWLSPRNKAERGEGYLGDGEMQLAAKLASCSTLYYKTLGYWWGQPAAKCDVSDFSGVGPCPRRSLSGGWVRLKVAEDLRGRGSGTTWLIGYLVWHGKGGWCGRNEKKKERKHGECDFRSGQRAEAECPSHRHLSQC